jgi:DNA-binding NtrC family response regulator
MTILVAEDDEILRDLLVGLFERHGFEVFPAATGNEAIRLLEQHPSIELVLSDYYMPDGDGGDLLAFVRRRDPRRPVFIMMTGQTDLAVSADTPGINEFLVKPFSVRELVKIVRGYLAPRAGR